MSLKYANGAFMTHKAVAVGLFLDPRLAQLGQRPAKSLQRVQPPPGTCGGSGGGGNNPGPGR